MVLSVASHHIRACFSIDGVCCGLARLHVTVLSVYVSLDSDIQLMFTISIYRSIPNVSHSLNAKHVLNGKIRTPRRSISHLHWVK